MVNMLLYLFRYVLAAYQACLALPCVFWLNYVLQKLKPMALPNFPNNYAAKEFQKHDFSYHFILFLHGKLMSVLP